ncbi:MAG: nucleotide excision repair endonuclease [Chitinispirillales bacterium]|jgi:hypothetical protein|nr:nucleotide excision repair endonuclease [Chitinispirillales bacterium]
MNDEITKYIREQPHGVTPEDIARRFLKFQNPNKTLAAAAVKAILGKDARVRCGDDGLWKPTATAAHGGGVDVAEAPWACVHVTADTTRRSIAHVSVWTHIPEPNCLCNVWLIDPATLSEEDREQLCDPRDPPYGGADAEQIARILSDKMPVFLSQNHYSALSLAAMNCGAGIDDYYLMNQLLRAVKEPPVTPLTLEKAAETLLGGFRTAESAYKRGELLCRAAAEVIGKMKAAGIENRGQLDAALRDGAEFDFTGKNISEKMISELPLRAGVYGFTDKSGAYIYIGKAVNLRRRVENYFRFNSESPEKLGKLRAAAHGLTIHVCGSELEALIYEHRLIKKHKPPLNSQLQISERKGSHKPLPDSVILLPHAQDGFRVSVWIRKDQKIKLRSFETDFGEEAALLKELREYFYSGTLPATPDDFPELEIVTRWIKRNRDADPTSLTMVNVEHLGAAADIVSALKNYGV